MHHPNVYGFRQILDRKLRGDNPSSRRVAEGYHEIYRYINQGGRSRDPFLKTILLHEYYDEDSTLSEAWLSMNGNLLTLDEVRQLYRALPPYSEKHSKEAKVILRQDDEENYITVDEKGYTMHITGWSAGGFSYERARREGLKHGVGPDTWAVMRYQHIRRLELCQM